MKILSLPWPGSSSRIHIGRERILGGEGYVNEGMAVLTAATGRDDVSMLQWVLSR